MDNRTLYEISTYSNYVTHTNLPKLSPRTTFVNRVTSTSHYSTESPSNTTVYDEYIYDYSETETALPLFEIIPVTIIYGITFIVGVIGNTLVIFSIVRYKRMRNVTNVFLTSLASADLLLVLLCVPVKVKETFNYILNHFVIYI